MVRWSVGSFLAVEVLLGWGLLGSFLELGLELGTFMGLGPVVGLGLGAELGLGAGILSAAPLGLGRRLSSTGSAGDLGRRSSTGCAAGTGLPTGARLRAAYLLGRLSAQRQRNGCLD